MKNYCLCHSCFAILKPFVLLFPANWNNITKYELFIIHWPSTGCIKVGSYPLHWPKYKCLEYKSYKCLSRQLPDQS